MATSANTRNRCFFILTTARSGSTSLARILDTASNGHCAVEPAPNLNVESRLAMDGRLADPRRTLEAIVVPRVREALATHEIYGEKNLTYGPFIRELHGLLGCRFVLIRRDGRDVVRSFLDWHNRMFGSVYRECRDPGDLAPRALAAAANLPVHLDTSDFARPRPMPGSPWHEEWEAFSRFEMCAYCWATINELFLDQLEGIPREAWIEIDYTRPTRDDVLRVASFCGLEGLTPEVVEGMLSARINSLRDRCDEDDREPRWTEWDGDRRRSFEALAGPAMARLGYWRDGGDRWQPPDEAGETAAAPLEETLMTGREPSIPGFVRAPLRWVYHSSVLRPLRERLQRGREAEARAAALEQRVEELERAEEERVGAVVRRVERLAEQVAEAGEAARSLSRDVHRVSRGQIAVSATGYRAVTARDLDNFFDQVEENYAEYANPVTTYERFIDGLRELEATRVLPMYEFATASAPDERLVGLRHDIDADPRTGLRLARRLARVGICGSFYVLHTAPWYGEFHDGLFVRHPEVEHWVRGFIVAGCELGIHADPFGAAQVEGVDGALALEEEIRWLRSLGAVIRGTAGHNSAPAYGAENSEVFVGRRLWEREVRTRDGRRLPIETLDEAALGLSYEATFAVPKPHVDAARADAFARDVHGASIRSEAWMRTYLVDNPCCDWAVDVQVWVVGRDRWVIGGRRDGAIVFEWDVGVDRVLDSLAGMAPGSRCLVVLHPEYFRGARVPVV